MEERGLLESQPCEDLLHAGLGHGAEFNPLTFIYSIGICISMAVDLELTPKTKRPAGERMFKQASQVSPEVVSFLRKYIEEAR